MDQKTEQKLLKKQRLLHKSFFLVAFSVVTALVSQLILPYIPARAALSDSLTACWTMDETSGTRFDSTVNNHDLTDNNTVTSVTGKIGNAASFNGTNEYLSLSSFAVAMPITINFWVNERARVDTADPAEANMLFYSDVSFAEASLDNGEIKYADANGSAWRSTGDTVALQTWTMLTFVSSDNNNIEIYLNGTSVHTASGTGLGFADFANGFIIAGWDVPPTKGFAEIYVDEMSVHSRALSASEVTSLYNSGNGTSCDSILNPAAASGGFGDFYIFD